MRRINEQPVDKAHPAREALMPRLGGHRPDQPRKLVAIARLELPWIERDESGEERRCPRRARLHRQAGSIRPTRGVRRIISMQLSMRRASATATSRPRAVIR